MYFYEHAILDVLVTMNKIKFLNIMIDNN